MNRFIQKCICLKRNIGKYWYENESGKGKDYDNIQKKQENLITNLDVVRIVQIKIFLILLINKKRRITKTRKNKKYKSLISFRFPIFCLYFHRGGGGWMNSVLSFFINPASFCHFIDFFRWHLWEIESFHYLLILLCYPSCVSFLRGIK